MIQTNKTKGVSAMKSHRGSLMNFITLQKAVVLFSVYLYIISVITHNVITGTNLNILLAVIGIALIFLFVLTILKK